MSQPRIVLAFAVSYVSRMAVPCGCENFLYWYQGGLDFFGLGNSILSPNNPWFHAGSQVAEDQTWFGSLRRNGGSSMSPTASRWRTAASVTAVPSSP
jgi:hypothetical protein